MIFYKITYMYIQFSNSWPFTRGNKKWLGKDEKNWRKDAAKYELKE